MIRGTDEAPAPDTGAGLEPPQTSPRDRRGPKRVGVAVLVLLVGASAIAIVRVASPGDRAPSPGPRPNGTITYIKALSNGALGVSNQDLFAIDPTSGSTVDLTLTPSAVESSPVFSPGGTKVAFIRNDLSGTLPSLQSSWGVYVMNSDGTGLRKLRSCGTGTSGCDVRSMAWSPDATRLAMAVDSGTRSDIQIIGVDSRRVATFCEGLSCGQGLGGLAWSPDGTRIAFSNEGVSGFFGIGLLPSAIWLANADGTGVHRLSGYDGPQCYRQKPIACPFDSRPIWSPDGTTIAFGSYEPTSGSLEGATSTAIMAIGSDGSGLHSLASCPGNDCNQGVVAAWSPDGRTLAASMSYDSNTISFIDPATGAVRSVRTCGQGGCAQPVELGWSPDGRELWFAGGLGRTTNLYVMAASGGDVREIVGGIEQASAWLPEGTVDFGSQSPSATTPPTAAGAAPPAGIIVFSSSNGSTNEDSATQIWSISTDGSSLKDLTRTTGGNFAPAISPDGRKIAFASDRPGDPNTEIYIMNVDGSGVRRLTDSGAGSGTPTWSPDGTQILYESNDQIWSVDPHGSGAHVVVASQAFGFSLSPDGSRLVAALSGLDNLIHLWIVDLASGERSQFLPLPGEQTDPTWSSDGNTIAFTWGAPTGRGIYLVGADGTGLRRLTDLGAGPVSFSPDGLWLAFGELTDALGPQIALIRSDGTGLRPLTQMKGFVGTSQIFSQTSDPSWANRG